MSAPRLSAPCVDCAALLSTDGELDADGRCAQCRLEQEMAELAAADAPAQAVEKRWCRHCGMDPAVYADGTCRACRSYSRRRADGALPSDEVLRRRCERRVDDQLASSVGVR